MNANVIIKVKAPVIEWGPFAYGLSGPETRQQYIQSVRTQHNRSRYCFENTMQSVWRTYGATFYSQLVWGMH